ncbi:uncharacterized protein EDB93DRAFT_1253871 [Suillus bovinus]|uniref:uncharacterized protein n=1 Tax=Suillus bovinus TaxID=48563 RepID=UPI001B883E76|nr:uncharacterized protein EDB93DRAFT_1253871 [Suillus bovinus]KAG2136573.1 hypothetical protein EDB93DRAFT_1253871 [Suillus bovinus]
MSSFLCIIVKVFVVNVVYNIDAGWVLSKSSLIVATVTCVNIIGVIAHPQSEDDFALPPSPSTTWRLRGHFLPHHRKRFAFDTSSLTLVVSVAD